MKSWACVLIAAGVLSVTRAGAQSVSEDEQKALQQSISEAANSPKELELAIENHLKQYPNSPRRAELENALVKTALQINDDPRLLEFGESVLARDPNDMLLLEHLAAALVRQGDKPDAARALDHARHLEDLVKATYENDKFEPGGGPEEVKRRDDFDRQRAKTLVLEARANGILGHATDAIQAAESSYKVYASVEAAREAARWLAEAGKDKEALQYLADAFGIGALHSADPDVASDRAQMAELYRKLHGSETGLGDLILKAYDDTSFALAARRAELRAYDPNSQLTDPMQFTLSSVDGDKLKLSSLLGKVVIIDFWATWCAPCRAQHPLYEEVKAKFKDQSDVVFLAVDADQNRELVKPFLAQMKWNQKVYFEDGLQALFQVSSIPTTVILGKNGQVFTRMIGYLPDRFVEMLTDRVSEALGNPPTPEALKSASPPSTPHSTPNSGSLGPAIHQ
jgi:thiol-disulfide isomerase/thioredoxin